MVNTPFSFSRTGLRDWLVQRFTAVVIMLYLACLFGFYIKSRPLTFTSWHGFMTRPAMQIFSLLSLLSVLAHAWIGIWTVITDYVTCGFLRISLEFGLILLLIAQLIWAIHILYGG